MGRASLPEMFKWRTGNTGLGCVKMRDWIKSPSSSGKRWLPRDRLAAHCLKEQPLALWGDPGSSCLCPSLLTHIRGCQKHQLSRDSQERGEGPAL